MSSKQLRKLRELRATESANKEEDDAESEEEETPRPSGFATLFHSTSSSDEAPIISSKAEAEASRSRRRRPRGVRTESTQPKGGVKSSSSKAEVKEDLEDFEVEVEMSQENAEVSQQTASFEAGPLTMRRADFSVEAERQRAIGRIGHFSGTTESSRARKGVAARARGQAEGRTIHHRRLFLVIPTAEEPWLRPDDTMVMTSSCDEDGAVVFDFEESTASASSFRSLKRILRSQDPNLLVQYLHRQSQFSVDGHLVLADHNRSQGSHEEALKRVRRAVYALECALHPDFSPFQATGFGTAALRPRVRLRINDSPEWLGWTWLRALWLYMQGLAGQGMHRTALEVCKLILAATLPRDPLRGLLWFDYLCLRSKQFEALTNLTSNAGPMYSLSSSDEFVGHRLDLAFPNIAYSIALAVFLKDNQALDLNALNEVSIADILPSTKESATASESLRGHIHLLRALLFFPLVLRPLLDEVGIQTDGRPPGGSPSKETFASLFSRQPFCNAADFRHSRYAQPHGRIAAAYAKRCGSLWKADLALRWLHAAMARLAAMHESSLFAAELTQARRSWSESELCASTALEDALDLLPEEGLTVATPSPLPLEQARLTRLLPSEADEEADFRGFNAFGAGAVNGHREDLPPTMSVHTSPFILFFQSLLPWSELDRSGVRIDPLTWSDILVPAITFTIYTGPRCVALFSLGAVMDLYRFLLQSWSTFREGR